MSEKSTATQTALDPTAIKIVAHHSLLDRIHKIQEDIAQRAFELFEKSGSAPGHELDHWFEAESEILHPAHMKVDETEDALTVQAEVPGFNANELQVSVEANRLTISGRKEASKEEKKKGKTIYEEHCSSELLRMIDLPVAVDSAKATATLKNGILDLTFPKAPQTKSSQIEVKAA
jgi:HSP20 family protein